MQVVELPIVPNESVVIVARVGPRTHTDDQVAHNRTCLRDASPTQVARWVKACSPADATPEVSLGSNNAHGACRCETKVAAVHSKCLRLEVTELVS